MYHESFRHFTFVRHTINKREKKKVWRKKLLEGYKKEKYTKFIVNLLFIFFCCRFIGCDSSRPPIRSECNKCSNTRDKLVNRILKHICIVDENWKSWAGRATKARWRGTCSRQEASIRLSMVSGIFIIHNCTTLEPTVMKKIPFVSETMYEKYNVATSKW